MVAHFNRRRGMKLKRNAVAALAIVAAVAVGGSSSALAQGSDRDSGDGQRCEKLIERIAQRLGVSTDQAKAALKARMFARIDEAVKNGRMSQERAAALKAKIDADLCAALGGMAQRKMEQRAALGMLRAAGAYLELSKAELRAQLPGTSLAALAVKQGQGKTAAGLKAARDRCAGGRRTCTAVPPSPCVAPRNAVRDGGPPQGREESPSMMMRP